jgi:hypothetical protein
MGEEGSLARWGRRGFTSAMGRGGFTGLDGSACRPAAVVLVSAECDCATKYACAVWTMQTVGHGVQTVARDRVKAHAGRRALIQHGSAVPSAVTEVP